MSKPEETYLKATKIQKTYQISSSTLRRWSEDGRIDILRTVGGSRLYKLSDVEKAFGVKEPIIEKTKVCYARVSSSNQKADLERQIEDLKSAYPGYEIISDIGSGVNFKRKGLLTLLERVYSGTVEEIAIMHKDRLCRYGYELIEFICKKSSTRIVVFGKNEEVDSNRELADDLLTVVNYFVAKRNGLRAGENKRKRKAQEAQEEEQQRKEGRETSSGEGNKDQIISNTGTKKKVKSMVRDSQVDI